MQTLHEQHCIPVPAGSPELDSDNITIYLEKLEHWQLHPDSKICRDIHFDNFSQTMQFVNAIAEIAVQQDHHPVITLGYDYCHVCYRTESIKGLTPNDFICAAKIEHLLVD